MKTVGQILSIERKNKNLSISDISIELKISKSIIVDLENDNIKNDSDIIFNIGHLRSYSNFLELDTDTIIKKFVHYCTKRFWHFCTFIDETILSYENKEGKISNSKLDEN